MGCVCDKDVCDKVVWQWCVLKMVFDKDVYGRWYVLKMLCDKDVCVWKMVCDKTVRVTKDGVCVTKMCVTKLCDKNVY